MKLTLIYINCFSLESQDEKCVLYNFILTKILFFSCLKLQEDEVLIKTLMSAKSLYEQGYDEKVTQNYFTFHSISNLNFDNN